MPETITLKDGLPGLPAGSIMTLGKDGLYRDETGAYWLAPRHVEENPAIVEPPPVEPETAYLYLDDAGVIVETKWQSTARDEARRSAGNFFSDLGAAERAAKRTAEALGGKTAALAAELSSELATVGKE